MYNSYIQWKEITRLINFTNVIIYFIFKQELQNVVSIAIS